MALGLERYDHMKLIWMLKFRQCLIVQEMAPASHSEMLALWFLDLLELFIFLKTPIASKSSYSGA